MLALLSAFAALNCPAGMQMLSDVRLLHLLMMS
jgi:hypothetical protein